MRLIFSLVVFLSFFSTFASTEDFDTVVLCSDGEKIGLEIGEESVFVTKIYKKTTFKQSFFSEEVEKKSNSIVYKKEEMSFNSMLGIDLKEKHKLTLKYEEDHISGIEWRYFYPMIPFSSFYFVQCEVVEVL